MSKLPRKIREGLIKWHDAYTKTPEGNTRINEYGVKFNDINKIQNIIERNQRSIQNIKELKMHNKQNYALKEILDFSEVYIKPTN